MNKEQIQNIVGIEKNRKLKRFIKTKGGIIIESKFLEYDDFMECFGIVGEDNIFEVVCIECDADNIEELVEYVKID